MRYLVIENFCDMQDNDRTYLPGDIYTNTNEARIRELSSAENKLGRPLIKAIGEQPVKVDNSFMNEAVVEEKPVKKTRGRRSTKQ